MQDEPGGLMLSRWLELGSEPLGTRLRAGEKTDERARRFGHRAVRHQAALVAGRDLQQLRHRTANASPLPSGISLTLYNPISTSPFAMSSWLTAWLGTILSRGFSGSRMPA